MKSAVLVALLMWLCSCEKKPDYSNITVAELLHERDNLIMGYNDTINSLNKRVEGLVNKQHAQAYHISKLYERIDSMQRKIMYFEDSVAFNAPSDWSNSISSPDDAGAYPPTKKDSVEWGLHGAKTEWIKP